MVLVFALDLFLGWLRLDRMDSWESKTGDHGGFSLRPWCFPSQIQINREDRKSFQAYYVGFVFLPDGATRGR